MTLVSDRHLVACQRPCYDWVLQPQFLASVRSVARSSRFSFAPLVISLLVFYIPLLSP